MTDASALDEAKKQQSLVPRSKPLLTEILLSSLEMLPLMAFIMVRALDVEIAGRILLAGGLASLVFGARCATRFRMSALYFSTNIFFLLASLILLSPFDDLRQFFLQLGEVGMFACIFILSLAWHFFAANGILDPVPHGKKSKIHSWALLGVMFACLFISSHFRGNENLAGGLPFILIVIAEKLLAHMQLRNR